MFSLPSSTYHLCGSFLRRANAMCCMALLLCAQPAHSQNDLTLAATYQTGVDVHTYWVSEKYDGIRAHWTGQRLLSRQGLPIDAPAWFTHGWPQQAMDGELWAGRQQFHRVQSAVAQGASPTAPWQHIQYMAFDLPEHRGPFTQRHAALTDVVQRTNIAWLHAAPQWQVHSDVQLQQQLRQFTAQGAEGLMLRKASADYRAGRSNDLLKLKLHDDAEATVVAHIPGKGQYQGMTGALLVEMPSGQRFKLGSGLSHAERLSPPAIGSTVTYRFNSTHPSGLPRFARYWRARSTDVTQPPGEAVTSSSAAPTK